MKIILVDNLIMPEDGTLASLDVHPHLGLLSLAAVADANGHCTGIFDPKRAVRDGAMDYGPGFPDAVARDLLRTRPDVVGFTALGCSFLFALNVATRLKREEPDLPILLGGPHASMLSRTILERFPQFDAVVAHEAEEVLLPVLDRLESRRFDLIPGVSWRDSGTVRCNAGKPKVEDLDTLPIASYDYYPVESLGLDLLRIEAGRGCPFACTFCSTAGFFQRSFRLKSAGRLVHELDLLNERYRISHFKLDHDMFTVNRRKVLEFCDAVAGRGYRWRASARVDCVDAEMLERMAASGCVGLYFGIETGSPRMQRWTQKRLDLALVEPILDAAHAFGIETTTSFITGFPEETQVDQDATLEMLGRCAVRTGCLPQLHVLAPEPGTPLIDQYGSTLEYDGYRGPYNCGFLEANDENTIVENPVVFPTYHYYPAALPRERHIFAAETVALLRRAGPIVLSYALRRFDGNLSHMVAACHAFAVASGAARLPPDIALLEAFIAATFGRTHPLVSLFRLGLRAYGGDGTRSARRAAAFDIDLPVRIGAGLQVLEQMHDCESLLELIRTDASGDIRALQGQPTYTYLVRPGGAQLTAYRAEGGTEAVLELFETPRSVRSVGVLLREVTGQEIEDWSFFQALFDHEILVPATAA